MLNNDFGMNPMGSPTLFDKLIWGIDDVCRFTAYRKGTIYNLYQSQKLIRDFCPVSRA